MKKIYSFLLVLSSLSTSYSQCTATALYPANTMTPTAAWTSISNANYAGEYANINVVAGNIYEFSTRAIDGSDVTYDSQLTLRSNSSALLAYNDDYLGDAQSYISWTATYTGVAQIHLHEYNCASNQTSSTIRMKMTSSAAGLNQLTNSIKQLVKIVDVMGRETEFKTNMPLIYVYSDGTTEQIFKFE
jgi:hypothetical protein